MSRLNTPRSAPQRNPSTLGWRDLARVADDVKLNARIRSHAERLLADRLDEISPGERAALARVANRTVIQVLVDARDPKVIGALLGNPRFLECDVARIAANPRTPPSVLSVIASHWKWSELHPIKMALARNPASAVADALRSLKGLEARELLRIAMDPASPRLVRACAMRRLDRVGEAPR